MLLAGLLAASVAAPCATESAALRAAADAIERRYVMAAQAPAIAGDLRRRVDRGAYGEVCTDPAAFLAHVNRDLDSYDGHFHFERLNARDGAEEDWLMAWRSGARSANAGVREVRVLEGNVGYLRLSSFYPWDVAKPKLAAALDLLRDADALVVDLRQNGGGNDATANQLLRALMGPDAPAVQDIERRSGRVEEPLPKAELRTTLAGRPLAILIDRRSASASEFVAYSLQATGQAVVVGDRSAGAAHIFGDPVKLPGGYALTIPDARPVNRLTGASWEGTGVRPDIPGGDDPLFVARRRLSESKPR